MSKIYAFTCTRADTVPRARLLLATINAARETAGIDFYWQIYCQIGTRAEEISKSALELGLINNVMFYYDNVGQHVATNDAILHATAQKYDYLLRLDDDVEFKTKRWLAKLVDASSTFDDEMILSPVVRGLDNPPARSSVTNVKGIDIEFLLEAIGGICRLHPMKLLLREKNPYISDVRLPLGAGDAFGIATWAKKNLIPLAYVRSINVRHAQGTKGQAEHDPTYHTDHDLFQHVPYIPPYHQPEVE